MDDRFYDRAYLTSSLLYRSFPRTFEGAFRADGDEMLDQQEMAKYLGELISLCHNLVSEQNGEWEQCLRTQSAITELTNLLNSLVSIASA